MAGVRLGVLVSFLLFFIAGIPLWWKTTEVYRAPIPNVAHWNVPQPDDERFPQAIEVHFPSQVAKPSEVLNVLKGLIAQKPKTNGTQIYVPKFEFSVSTNRFLAKYKEENDGNGKESDYDDILWDNFGSYESTGRMYFFVVHSPKAPAEGEFFFLKTGGVLVKTSLALHEGAGVPHKVLGSIADAVQRYWNGVVDTEHRRITVPAASEHRITFTLMSGAELPEGANADRFAKAVSKYFTDFAKNLTMATTLSITTQVQQMVSPIRAPQFDAKTGTYFYTREMLPYFLRPADLISDATATNQSTLHFIMYLPSADISPLRVRESQTNAFLIPRTGGVLIQNVFDAPDTSSLGLQSKDLVHAMRVFSSQLRELLGVPIIRIPGAKIIPAASGLTYWERDLVFKYRIADYLRSAVASLTSIHRLVSTITHMGVQDDVKARVERILLKIEEAKGAIRDSAYFTALKASRTAFVESERLFFDPNMLPQLYFPDEHKYAIYVPMFPPILVPILTGLYGEFRERRQGGKKKEVTQAKKNN